MYDYRKFYINGAWVDPIEPRELEIIDPATEEVIGRISAGTARDVDRAVAAAREASRLNSAASRIVSDREVAQAMFKQAGLSEVTAVEADFWNAQIISAQASLAEAQKELAEVLAGSSVQVTTDIAIEMQIKQFVILLSLVFALTSCKTGRIQEEPVKTELKANPAGSVGFQPFVVTERRDDNAHFASYPLFPKTINDLQ